MFMYHYKYTPAAWGEFIKKPEDRGALVDGLLKNLGGCLVSIYYTTGQRDGLVIYEAPLANVGHGRPHGHRCARPHHGDPDMRPVQRWRTP